MKRINQLNNVPLNKSGKYVLYLMQSSVRVSYNLTLYEVINKANDLNKPIVVLFVISEQPVSNERQLAFLLEGLKEVHDGLKNLHIKLVVERGNVVDVALKYSKNASILYLDVGYTKGNQEIRKNILNNVNVPVVSVEDNVVVPVEVASNKEEYGAYTIRRKILSKLNEFLVPYTMPQIQCPKNSGFALFDNFNINSVLSNVNFQKDVKRSPYFKGGYSEAKKKLDEFVNNKLPYYKDKKNDFCDTFTSNLSPYLHFGQISPVEVALSVIDSDAPEESKEVFLDELIVRRELSINFVHYNPRYDRLEGLQSWAYETIKMHGFDERPYRYSFSTFENAETHDMLWNAAQKELVKTGKIHGYLRMYWGKKVIEWSESPEAAFKYLVTLNNKYALDGNDPNTYAGVAWCFGKHDRPFRERPIFGKVRYIGSDSISRKFDVTKYIERINNL